MANLPLVWKRAERPRSCSIKPCKKTTASPRYFPPSSNIVIWAVRAETASASSERARKIYESAEKNDLHLALATFPRAMVEPTAAVAHWDRDDIVCLRSCVMKPEHRDWMPEILRRLNLAGNS